MGVCVGVRLCMCVHVGLCVFVCACACECTCECLHASALVSQLPDTSIGDYCRDNSQDRLRFAARHINVKSNYPSETQNA